MLLLLLFIQASLLALVVGQYIPITVVVESDGTLAESYCEAKGKECRGVDLETVFAADPNQCHVRCSRNLQCQSAFYIDQICHSRAERCSTAQLQTSTGTTYYRLKTWEICPSGQPVYVETSKAYSSSFCFIASKSCPGHNLYKTSQNIKSYLECLQKCARIKSCAGVDYVEGKCSPKNYQCSDAELIDAPVTENHMRLEKGVTSCPCNRPGRYLLPPTPPVPITLVLLPGIPLDLSGTNLTLLYCEAKYKECTGANLETVFAADPHECHARCNRNLQCLTAFYSNDQICNLRANRCTSDQLLPSTGTTYYRLKKGETCPGGQQLYVEASKAYSNSFCLNAGKSCPGYNLYPTPQNIQPYQECLAKCARITSCSGADYVDGKCSPKKYQCSEDKLVYTPGTVNYVRLEKGVTTCPCRKPLPVQNPPPGREQVPLLVIGARVKRGLDWNWSDEDGPAPSLGTIIPGLSAQPGWVGVEWDSGKQETYRIGYGGKYDLQLA